MSRLSNNSETVQLGEKQKLGKNVDELLQQFEKFEILTGNHPTETPETILAALSNSSDLDSANLFIEYAKHYREMKYNEKNNPVFDDKPKPNRPFTRKYRKESLQSNSEMENAIDNYLTESITESAAGEIADNLLENATTTSEKRITDSGSSASGYGSVSNEQPSREEGILYEMLTAAKENKQSNNDFNLSNGSLKRTATDEQAIVIKKVKPNQTGFTGKKSKPEVVNVLDKPTPSTSAISKMPNNVEKRQDPVKINGADSDCLNNINSDVQIISVKKTFTPIILRNNNKQKKSSTCSQQQVSVPNHMLMVENSQREQDMHEEKFNIQISASFYNENDMYALTENDEDNLPEQAKGLMHLVPEHSTHGTASCTHPEHSVNFCPNPFCFKGTKPDKTFLPISQCSSFYKVDHSLNINSNEQGQANPINIMIGNSDNDANANVLTNIRSIRIRNEAKGKIDNSAGGDCELPSSTSCLNLKKGTANNKYMRISSGGTIHYANVCSSDESEGGEGPNAFETIHNSGNNKTSTTNNLRPTQMQPPARDAAIVRPSITHNTANYTNNGRQQSNVWHPQVSGLPQPRPFGNTSGQRPNPPPQTYPPYLNQPISMNGYQQYTIWCPHVVFMPVQSVPHPPLPPPPQMCRSTLASVAGGNNGGCNHPHQITVAVGNGQPPPPSTLMPPRMNNGHPNVQFASHENGAGAQANNPIYGYQNVHLPPPSPRLEVRRNAMNGQESVGQRIANGHFYTQDNNNNQRFPLNRPPRTY